MFSPEQLLAFLVAAPGALFALLALLWLLGWKPPEKLLSRVTATLFSTMAIACAWLGWTLSSTGDPAIRASFPAWFQAGEYHFELLLIADHLSWPLMMLTVLLVGLVGVFSVRYVHRDRGFFRFFLLLHLFACGAMLVLAAGTYDLLLGGWELVGISSVLLIAFFDQRPEPVRNAVRVFAFLRIADLGLLLGLFTMHTQLHTTRMDQLFTGVWPGVTTPLSGSAGLITALLLLMAAAGKSAQAPFSGWLPRAMEGPTPSSAIFYGAISVHLGAYLLLRSEPILRVTPWAAAAAVAVGGVTAVLATFVHRVCSDAKTSLAYAGMAQLGIIFVEIGLGFPRLALAHIGGHAVVRTLQFLRAPSMLHDFHRVHAAAGGQLGKTGVHYQHLVPGSFRLMLYRAAIERGYYDALLDRLVVNPFLRFARVCESLEPPAPPREAPTAKPAIVFMEGVES
jgi:NADH-quinone oxidoreductase subunit L